MEVEVTKYKHSVIVPEMIEQVSPLYLTISFSGNLSLWLRYSSTERQIIPFLNLCRVIHLFLLILAVVALRRSCLNSAVYVFES